MGQQVQPPERLEIPDDPHEDSSVQDAVSALGNDLAGHSLISPWRDSVLVRITKS